MSKTSSNINHSGCSVIVAFLTEEYNIVTGERMKIGTTQMDTFHSFHTVIPICRCKTACALPVLSIADH